MAPEVSVVMGPQRVDTQDGSATYLHPVHGASYRSLRGAATESRWVFLQGSGLLGRSGVWSVLELGFGSGLNFQVTEQASREAQVSLQYTSLEPELMPSGLWLVADRWRTLRPNQEIRHGSCSLTVLGRTWENSDLPRHAYHALYHDPFGPVVTPECWSQECFHWAAERLRDDGVLATYGASTAARAAMRQAGLCVGILPGAPGKREMTVAARSQAPIAHARPWKPQA